MRAAAILLAGGRATRMGGVDKPLVEVHGRSLLQRAVDAVHHCSPIVVVGPPSSVEGAQPVWVREDPPFGGPAAAIVAAVDLVGESDWTFVLACDLPFAADAVAALTQAIGTLPAGVDGVCLGDGSSRPQWLSGVYGTRALREAASTLPDRGRDAPVRALIDELAIAVVAAPHAAQDIDTWEDLREIEEDRHE
ncbi:molybdenum cofactor guanylyltransferase [Microbacterium rhizosphaerae]|uniref:Molybdenum cofactor guanylyltransferase n=1 Tax=Microbacterium rhizosphaerae TaxID=1678237 RepID=A0ABZ0SME4_9MICO|nr:molybdenum cofactor guanylyltransferase [Microbacterium rhizosphaerae]WPR88998.1 molybdenum cofactor guanylyltransferase [Microbacterium rhizosphaerae]